MLGRLKREHHGRKIEGVCGGWVGGGQNTERENNNPDVPNQHDSIDHAQTLPLQQEGREGLRDVGPLPSAQAWN